METSRRILKKSKINSVLCILSVLVLLNVYLRILVLTNAEPKPLTAEELEIARQNTKDNENYKFLDAVWQDAKYFPVPASSSRNEKYTVNFENSWMAERTVGGKRGHEGCDIIPEHNFRDYYPVVSMSDGVIEKMGWLYLGGYRIGIRSPNGVYFYYAHLSEYAPDLKVGDEVSAGTLLGFMGDTGYSEVPGTTGNFIVHLHVGIYINYEDYGEISLNPYFVLKELEENRIQCQP